MSVVFPRPIDRIEYLRHLIVDYSVTDGLTAAVRALLEQRSLFTAEHVAAIDAARELGKPRSGPIRVYPSVDARQNGSRNIHALAASSGVGPQQTKPLSQTDQSLTKPSSPGSSEEKSFGIFPMATPHTLPNPPPRLSDSYKSLPSESEGYTSPLVIKHTPYVCPDAPQANRQRISAPMTQVSMKYTPEVCPDTPQANRQRVSAPMTPFSMKLNHEECQGAPKKPIWKSAKGNFWLEAVEFKMD